MRKLVLTLLTATTLLSVSTGLAQRLVPQKDVSFAQVAVGPTIDTVLTLTNRGTYEQGYSGVLMFKQGTSGAAWNPRVNGAVIDKGEFPITILPDETLVLRITGGDTVESGFVILQANDLILDNFVEANLTYFLRSNGAVVDSVGVAPSTEFYLTSIPFENFSTIALALANPSDNAEPVSVQITPIDGDGTPLSGKSIQLASYAHEAQYLTELFPGVAMGKGKVEIASSRPILGTALTQINGQLSSLPLAPSPVAYNISLLGSAGSGIPNYDGALALWAEGYFVKGYLVISRVGDQDIQTPFVIFVNGQLTDRFLDLSFFAESQYLDGDTTNNRLLTIYLGDEDFLFGDDQASGSWIFTYLSDGTTDNGTFTAVRTTP